MFARQTFRRHVFIHADINCKLVASRGTGSLFAKMYHHSAIVSARVPITFHVMEVLYVHCTREQLLLRIHKFVNGITVRMLVGVGCVATNVEKKKSILAIFSYCW